MANIIVKFPNNEHIVSHLKYGKKYVSKILISLIKYLGTEKEYLNNVKTVISTIRMSKNIIEKYCLPASEADNDTLKKALKYLLSIEDDIKQFSKSTPAASGIEISNRRTEK